MASVFKQFNSGSAVWDVHVVTAVNVNWGLHTAQSVANTVGSALLQSATVIFI